jgi:hypothetical protein
MAWSAPFAMNVPQDAPPWQSQMPFFNTKADFGRATSDISLNGASFRDGFMSYDGSRDTAAVVQRRVRNFERSVCRFGVTELDYNDFKGMSRRSGRRAQSSVPAVAASARPATTGTLGYNGSPSGNLVKPSWLHSSMSSLVIKQASSPSRPKTSSCRLPPLGSTL